jgi:predicted glycosyltransferase
MAHPRSHSRVLIYSHDSMGLGHLRRCRAIAHALVDVDPTLSVIILSGSPIIGSFDFRTRVDFVRVPGVIKLRNGAYTSLTLPIAIEETLEMRASIMRHTAAIFDPDLFIVDKEPLGLRGEVRPTLELMRQRGTPVVLGLRDILDEQSQLETEWERKNVMPALEDLYDEIWVYGLPEVSDPLEGMNIPSSVRAKMMFTGYLPRAVGTSASALSAEVQEITDQPYLLVTPGGGGDGEILIDWVLKAYEATDDLPWPALLVFGPFMSAVRQAEFNARAAHLPRVRTMTFDAKIEALMLRAAGLVAMGGYNTFCEILSFDKRALIVPRTEPRLEQWLRACKAKTLGLAQMLVPEPAAEGSILDPAPMIEALRRLPDQRLPSSVVVPGLLGGLENVQEFARKLLSRRPPRLAVAHR